MIAARPEGLAVDVEAEPLACASGWEAVLPSGCVTIDDKSDPGSWARALAERARPVIFGVDYSSDYIAEQRANERCNVALGILMLAAAKCADVQALADSGRIDRDGADLFQRRYSESICDIASALAPEAMRDTISMKGN
jgi:hypothetical protein